MENRTLGEKIEYYRKRAKMSQLDLEISIDAAQGSISRIEGGQTNPTKETLIKISNILNLNSKEIGELFNIEVQDSFKPVLQANYEVFKSLSLDEVLQNCADLIVTELNLFACFIVLVEGETIVAQTSTNNWARELTHKILGRGIKGLSLPLDENSPNLMVQTVLQKKPMYSEHSRDFTYPAINMNLAVLLEKIPGAKSCISLPIIYNGEVIGAIMVGKNIIEDYSKEMNLLEEFAKHIALAINNAKQYEKLKAEFELLKNGK